MDAVKLHFEKALTYVCLQPRECVKEGVSFSRSFSLSCRRLMRGHYCFTTALYQSLLPLHLSFALAITRSSLGRGNGSSWQHHTAKPLGTVGQIAKLSCRCWLQCKPFTHSFHLTLSADYSTMQEAERASPHLLF